MSNDVIKCYYCANDWLAEKMGVSNSTIDRALKELTEAGLLFSEQQMGGMSFRVPLDPADTNYSKMVEYINAFKRDKRIRTDNWIKKNKPKQSVVNGKEDNIPIAEESATDLVDKAVVPIVKMIMKQANNDGVAAKYQLELKDDGNIYYSYIMEKKLKKRLSDVGEKHGFKLIQRE